MRSRSAFLLPLAFAGMLLATGCFWMVLGAGAGAAGTAYQMGKLRANVDVPLSTAYDASLRGLEDLRIPVRGKDSDALVANINALTADNKEVRINLKKRSDRTTEMVIFILPWPDENRTLAIYEQIDKRIEMAKRTTTP